MAVITDIDATILSGQTTIALNLTPGTDIVAINTPVLTGTSISFLLDGGIVMDDVGTLYTIPTTTAGWKVISSEICKALQGRVSIVSSASEDANRALKIKTRSLA